MNHKNKQLTCSFWLIFLVIFGSACQENAPKTTLTEPAEKTMEVPLPPREEITLSPEETSDALDAFTPNPYFEKYLTGLTILGQNFVVMLEYPQGDKRHPLKNNQFLFRIKGHIESKTGASPEGFKLRLFSNQIQDFKADKTLFEWDIPLKLEDGLYQFKMANVMDVSPGIYYYSIENEVENEPFLVGKISLL